jgi:hypothetical protein
MVGPLLVPGVPKPTPPCRVVRLHVSCPIVLLFRKCFGGFGPSSVKRLVERTPFVAINYVGGCFLIVLQRSQFWPGSRDFAVRPWSGDSVYWALPELVVLQNLVPDTKANFSRSENEAASLAFPNLCAVRQDIREHVSSMRWRIIVHVLKASTVFPLSDVHAVRVLAANVRQIGVPTKRKWDDCVRVWDITVTNHGRRS